MGDDRTVGDRHGRTSAQCWSRRTEHLSPSRYDARMSDDCVAVPADTSLDVWRIYVAKVRALTPQQRVIEAEKFIRLERKAEVEYLKQRFPDLGPGEFAVEVVRYRHGDVLANAVTETLLKRHQVAAIRD